MSVKPPRYFLTLGVEHESMEAIDEALREFMEKFLVTQGGRILHMSKGQLEEKQS